MDISSEQIDVENCQACGCAMDVSMLIPFTNVLCPECGQDTRVKCSVGGYKLKKRQGVGGMSLVFGAEDVTLGREVAIKILNESYSMDEKRIAEFEKEAQITAAISHPHVVRVYTVGQAFGRYYIAMELVKGGSLEQKMADEGKLSDEDVVSVAIQVCEGLNAAHQAGLIHRDIKPGNILFDRQGHAKIVDFGLALVTQGGKAKADEIWATPFYVPPETLDCLEEDLRSDIYALGASLYHALAGAPPFTTETRSTTELRNIKTNIPQLQAVTPQVNGYLAEVIDKAMAFEPADRYQSYDEMLLALRHAEHAIRIGDTKKTQTSAARAKRRQSGKPIGLMLGSAAILVLIAGVAVYSLTSDQPEAPTEGDKTVTGVDFNGEAKQKLIAAELSAARSQMKAKNYEGAAKRYFELALDESVPSETAYWAGFQASIASWLDGRSAQARQTLQQVRERLIREGGAKSDVEQKMDRIAVLLLQFAPIKPEQLEPPADALDGMLLFAVALKDWEQGEPKCAQVFFQRMKQLRLDSASEEITLYKSLVDDYLADYNVMQGMGDADEILTLGEADHVRDKLAKMQEVLRTKGRARFNLQQKQLQTENRVRFLEKRVDASSDQ